MKRKAISVLSLSLLLSLQTLQARECHVGFKIGNGIFTQELRGSTERRLNLKEFAPDQFSMDQLSFTAEREYDKRGYFQKCNLKNVEYGGENFVRLGTALKKGLVGTGLFTAGVATFYLTVLAAMEPANQTQAVSVDNKSLSENKDLVIITTYDHLDPFYYVPIVSRRVYRTNHIYYHHHYMSAYEYHRMRSIEAGMIAATLLIVEAFQVPKNMRSTNFQGPAEKAITEEDCTVEAIKEKLVFDQYLYCGEFSSKAAKKFSQKENTVRETVAEAFGAIKRGKFSKAEKYFTHSLNHQIGNDQALNQLRNEMVGTEGRGINGVVAVDGRSPFDREQRLKMEAFGREVEVVCQQEWSYQKNDLFAVGADFIPLNAYSECKLDKI